MQNILIILNLKLKKLNCIYIFNNAIYSRLKFYCIPNEIEDGNSLRSIEEVLPAAKKLKESVKFKKKVFINKDMTFVEIVQLKQLIVTRNDLNKKLEISNTTSSTIATYRYGIRSNRVVKILFKKKLI